MSGIRRPLGDFFFWMLLVNEHLLLSSTKERLILFSVDFFAWRQSDPCFGASFWGSVDALRAGGGVV